jgi:hypothetical protein
MRLSRLAGGENHESRLYLSRHTLPVPTTVHLVTVGHKLLINMRKLIASAV